MRQTLDNVVPPRRFERLTYGLGIRCSIQLSYGGIIVGYYHACIFEDPID